MAVCVVVRGVWWWCVVSVVVGWCVCGVRGGVCVGGGVRSDVCVQQGCLSIHADRCTLIMAMSLWTWSQKILTSKLLRRAPCRETPGVRLPGAPGTAPQKHHTTESESAIRAHKAVSATSARFPKSVVTYGNEHMSTKHEEKQRNPCRQQRIRIPTRTLQDLGVRVHLHVENV